MKNQDVIQDNIGDQIEDLFEQIKKAIKTHRGNTALVDAEIQSLWQEFRIGLDFFLNKKKLNQHDRKYYILYSESCFAQYRMQYNDQQTEGYTIKLHPKTNFIEPPPRDILSTALRLSHGRQHFHIAADLKTYWQSDHIDLSKPELIWGNLYLSLIYCSGCHHLQYLLAIVHHLFEINESKLYISLLYDAESKSNNPLVLTYRVKHAYYGNQIGTDQLVYQWRQVWLNPYAIFFCQLLFKAKLNSYLQMPHDVIRSIETVFIQLKEKNHISCKISNVLEDLNKLKRLSDKKLDQVNVINVFKDLHLGLEIDVKLNLDMCLSQVLQQHLKTVALSPDDQNLSWLDGENQQKEFNLDQSLDAQLIKMEKIGEIKTVAENLKTIPFELILFEKTTEEQSTKKKRQKQQEKLKWLRWSNIQERLAKQSITAQGEEKNLIAAQLRLLAWIHNLKERKIKISSIERYLSSFAKDYLFYIYVDVDDIENMSAEDYEEFYHHILNDLDQRDQVKAIQDKRKNHNRAQYAFGQLKAFHHFCMKKFSVPPVEIFKSNQFQRIQICRSKWISPRLWHQFKQALQYKLKAGNSLQEQSAIQQLMGMCILSYRLGLRLNEVRGLSFTEVICPNLRSTIVHKNRHIQISLKNHAQRRLKSANAKRQLDLNITLLEDEFSYMSNYLKDRLSLIGLHCNLKHELVFAANQEVLSEQSIHEMIAKVWSDIVGEHHGFTFHSFRHSAANQQAIAWLGSKALVTSYTDYSWKQVRHARTILFGEKAMEHENVIQHKWRLLADWMGHSNIEQTASHYLHALDLLAIDRLSQMSCDLNPKIFKHVVPSYNKIETLNLNLAIQRHKEFTLYHKAKRLNPTPSSITPIKLAQKSKLSVYGVVRDYIDRGLNEDHRWNQRAIWLANKLQHPKYANKNWSTENQENSLDSRLLTNLYKAAVKKGFDIQEHPEQRNRTALYSLEVFIKYAKLRKNFIHFQERMDKNGQSRLAFDMDQFLEGFHLFLPENSVETLQNYPIDTMDKSRVIKLSIEHPASQKNITVAVVFTLLLKAIEHDLFWK